MKPDESNTSDSGGRHSAVVASALDAIITIDGEGTILEFNPSASQTFGWSEGEAVGRPLSELIIPERYRRAHQAGMAHYLKTGEGPVLGKRIEIEALHKSGREMPVELAITPIQTEWGTVFTAFLRDLSESKALTQRLSMVNFTIEQSSDSIYWINERAEIINCNLAAANSLGYPRDEVIGMRIFDMDTTMLPEMWSMHWEDLQKAKTIQIESVHKRSDGTTFPVEVNANHIVHDGVEYNCAFARDITQREETQRRIFESSRRLELVLDAAEIGFWDWNLRSGEKVVNEQYLALCSSSRENYSPSPSWFQDLIHPDDVEAAHHRLQRHLAGEIERIDSQFRLRKADGGWRWVHDRGRVIERDESGIPVRAMGTMQDVTLRRGAIEALKESEQRFRDIVSSMGEFVWEADQAFRLRFISDPIADIIGVPPADLIDTRVDQLASPNHRDRIAERLRSCLRVDQSVVSIEFPAQTGAGGTRWIQISAQPIRNSAGEHVGFRGIGLDITEQRVANESKRRSAELQEISRSIVMGLLEPGDLVPQIESLLSRLAEFLGADRAYLLRAETSNNSVTTSSHWFSARLQGSSSSYPMSTSNTDPVQLMDLQPGRPVVIQDESGERPPWLQPDTAAHIGFPVLVGNAPLNYLAFDWLDSRLPAEQDISILLGLAASLGHSIERRITKRQLEESTEQLAIEAKRSEEASKAKSAFLAHMSHELRTPLTAVLGCSEILANGKPDEHQVQQLLESIQSNGRSLLAQINSVLELSRYEQGGTPVRPEPVRVLDMLD
ncbi:MAG: PAS domain S-box protein, partial [Planctomycetota bacterium]